MGILHLNTYRLAAPISYCTPDSPNLMQSEDQQSARPISALFVTASLFNHSCTPNVHVSFGCGKRARARISDGDSFAPAAFSFLAAEDINAGTVTFVFVCLAWIVSFLWPQRISMQVPCLHLHHVCMWPALFSFSAAAEKSITKMRLFVHVMCVAASFNFSLHMHRMFMQSQLVVHVHASM
jgi:hypothetical protein